MTKEHALQNVQISVIIPTYNGAESLPELFEALQRQTVRPLEIIVGDSESEDETVSICRRYHATVIPVERVTFDHGGTRTLLSLHARGDFLLFLTQDAIPANEDCIEKLVCQLADNPDLGCAYGRQLARHDATLFARHLREFNYPATSYRYSYADRQEKGLKTIFISNSCAMYKKQTLAACGYFKNGLIFGEDTYTLGKMLKAGFQVAYMAEASVYHSHNYSLLEEFHRSFDIGVLHGSEKWLLDTYGRAEGVGTSYIDSLFRTIVAEKKFTLIFDFLARCLVKAVGYKLGKNHKRLPQAVVPYLSLHSSWWLKKPEAENHNN